MALLMALFQSGPYQSKVIAGAVRWGRHWLEQGVIAGRRLRTATSWTAQIILYPVYGVFQAGRGLRARLEFVLEGGESRFPAMPVALPVQIDESVLGMLRAVGAIALPPTLPPLPPNEAISLSDNIFYPVGPLALAPATGLQRVKQAALRRLHAARSPAQAAIAKSQIQNPQIQNPQIQNPQSYQVRGLATRLDTGALVLVTDQNQVLDILSHGQQVALRQRLVVEMATAGRALQGQRKQLRTWLRAYGPIVAVGQTLPLRWLRGVMGWMQGSPVAIAANLFHEADLLPGTATMTQLRLAGAQMDRQFQAWQTIVFPVKVFPVKVFPVKALPVALPTVPGPQPLAPADSFSLTPMPAAISAARPAAIAPGPTAPKIPKSRIPEVKISQAQAAENFASGLASGLGPGESAIAQRISPAIAPAPAPEPQPKTLMPEPGIAGTTIPPNTNQNVAQNIAQNGGPRSRPDGHPWFRWLAQLRAPAAHREPLREPVRIPYPRPTNDAQTIPYPPRRPPNKKLTESASQLAQDYVETQAALISYMKTPIEQVLRWLDQMFVWLESQVERLLK